MPTILLADDSITIQKIVNLTFSGEGIDVVTVGNGEAAVKKIHEIRPALVLADIFMPGKNGYEVCDYVKNDPSLTATPVILLVGAFEPFDSNEAARVKADGHLTKPFEIKVLISAVNSLISTASEPKDTSEQPAVEVPISEVTDSTDEAPVASSFSPLPDMPTTSRAVDIEVPVELPAAELAPEEVAAPIALGVDVQDAELLAPTASEPVEEAISVAEPVVTHTASAQPLGYESSLPSSLMIEDADPLGLLGVDGGAGTGGDREIALDARSMVVDIWEPRTTAEGMAPAVSEEPALLVQETKTEIATAKPLTEAEVAPAPISQSTKEGPPVEPSVRQMVSSSESVPAPQLASEPTAVHPVVSEELIERIANRVVEKLSREVIERIAWEVVPDLAELMIKEHVDAQLKESQPR
jgi:CheY-like chemotaxis protein